ncbi:unnamed protein product, partial [Closterium sp. NIES-53]
RTPIHWYSIQHTPTLISISWSLTTWCASRCRPVYQIWTASATSAEQDRGRG